MKLYSSTNSLSAFAKPSHFLLLNTILRLTFSSQLTPPPSDPPSNAPWFFNRLRRYTSFVLTYLLTYLFNFNNFAVKLYSWTLNCVRQAPTMDAVRIQHDQAGVWSLCQRMRWQSHWQTLRELSEDKWLYALGHSLASVSYIAIDKEFNRSLAGLAGNEAVGRRRDTRRGKKERRRRLTRARKLQLIQRVNNWAARRGAARRGSRRLGWAGAAARAHVSSRNAQDDVVYGGWYWFRAAGALYCVRARACVLSPHQQCRPSSYTDMHHPWFNRYRLYIGLHNSFIYLIYLFIRFRLRNDLYYVEWDDSIPYYLFV